MFFRPFLAVQSSFWPVLVSLSLFTCMANTVLYINLKLAFSSVLVSVFFLALVTFL